MPRASKAARFALKNSNQETRFASFRANTDITRSALILGSLQIGEKMILAIFNQAYLFRKVCPLCKAVVLPSSDDENSDNEDSPLIRPEGPELHDGKQVLSILHAHFLIQ